MREMRLIEIFLKGWEKGIEKELYILIQDLMDRKLIQLLSKYGKAENPSGQIIDLSTIITAFLTGDRGYGPSSTHIPVRQTVNCIYTYTNTYSALEYNIWFI